MYPFLFNVGPIKVSSYGVMIGAGFVAGIFILLRLARQDSLPARRLVDLAILVALGAIVGARLGYVLLRIGYYLSHPLEAITVWQGGLSFYGGVLGGVVVGFIFVRWVFGLPLWRVLDVFAPAMALGSAFGRIGCFLAGCCFGIPSNLPWAVAFGPRAEVSLLRPDLVGVPLHPTQLYYASGLLLLFFFLVWLWRRRTFLGQIFWTYGFCHALIRMVMEPLRGDKALKPVVFGILTETQFTALVLGSLSLIMYFVLWRRAKMNPNEKGMP